MKLGLKKELPVVAGPQKLPEGLETCMAKNDFFLSTIQALLKFIHDFALDIKELKSDLAIRPIYHQRDDRIEAHIFVAFVAYCLMVTLKHRLRALAPGLTPRAVLEKLATIQMVDVQMPTTDGRQIVLSRYTQPERDVQLLLQRLKLSLPPQPPPKISALPS